MSAINPASFASPNSTQVPNLVSTLPIDRDRGMDLHPRSASGTLGGLDYQGASRGALGPPWNDGYGFGVPNHPTAHPYDQLFHAPAPAGRYPSAVNHAHDVVQGTYVAPRATVSYGPVAYPVSANGGSGHVYGLHETRDGRSKAPFDGQLRSLQDMSLGT